MNISKSGNYTNLCTGSKLQAGRNLTQSETSRLNTVLDYIDAVTATDTSTAPDVIWPELPETAQ
ncbi:caudovirales tail fiber assembly family protein [Escherichia coli 5-366-08_S1_C1]|nr:caudovirales tail fiber assembly family protein [Escherichia coli 5-366-08_S1_C3]KEL65679.1 caudovirales tail fiber assembly family protein [Escherichia coli 5-366-08_S1_C1]